MRALLHQLKYEGMEPIARPLGRYIAQQVACLPALPAALTVVPVPLFAAKQHQRGYNQAALLARAVVHAGKQQGMAWVFDDQLLRRKRATVSQAGLSTRQRRENVRGAFFVPGSRRDPNLSPVSEKATGHGDTATRTAPGTSRHTATYAGPKPLSARPAPPRPSPAMRRLHDLDILLIDDIYTTGATARAASLALREAGAASVWVATAARAQRLEAVPLPDLPMQEDVAFW